MAKCTSISEVGRHTFIEFTSGKISVKVIEPAGQPTFTFGQTYRIAIVWDGDLDEESPEVIGEPDYTPGYADPDPDPDIDF